MSKIKGFLSAYGVYVLILVLGFAGGVLYGRYNFVIVTESNWDKLVRSAQAIEEMKYESELQSNLKGME